MKGHKSKGFGKFVSFYMFFAMKWLWLRNFALLGFPFLISAAMAKPTHKKPAWEKTTEKDHDPLSEIEPFLSVGPMYVVSNFNLE